MVVSLKHSKASTKSDSADATLVQPSDWNAEHTITAAQGTILGRTTAGTGAVEEITVGAGITLASQLLNTSSLVPLTDTTNTFAAKQIFSGDGGTSAPLHISASYTPSSLSNGDIWFASNRLRYRQASTTYEVPRFDTANNWTAQNTFSAINVTGGAIAGITDLALADGGTGASDAATARTNLGLGSIATQSATSVAITGGALSGVSISQPSIIGTIVEDIYTLTDGATVDIDPSNGSIQLLTLTSTGRTLTFTNMANGEAVTLMVNDGTSGTITTWSADFVNGGGAPTLSTTGYTVVAVWKVGGTVYAATVGND